jgi:Tol biopolymer transport system component
LLRRCLTKDRKKRLHDIADARVELEEAIADPANSALELAGAVTSVPPRAPRAFLILAPFAMLAVAAFAALAAWQLKPDPAPTRPVLRKLEFVVDGVGDDESLGPVISPDGSRVIYVADGSLWVRALSDLEAIELTGTEGARAPFWSPDGTQVGFFYDARLWRMPVSGGARSMICRTPRGLWGAGGAAWLADGRVAFTTAWGGPFWEVPVGGGDPQAMFTPDAERVRDFHHASVLPDGSGVLSVLHRAKGEADTIVVVSGDSFKEILEDPHTELGSPLYANGYIVYERNQMTGTIWAVPFSLATLEVTGSPFLIADSAESPSVSRDGTLVYAPGTYIGTGQLVWVDRMGTVLELIGQPQAGLYEPVVSPDDARVAAYATESGASQIWIHELSRGTRRPLLRDRVAMWISDWVSNDILVYTAGTKTYARSVATSDPPELLVDGDRSYQTVISAEQRYAAVERRVGKSLDIYYYDLQEGSGALPLFESDATEVEPVIRPGSGWIAYVSNETGREEVYIAEFPSGASQRQVSIEGGTTPVWSRAGDELFFQTGRSRDDDPDIMSVNVTTEPQLLLTKPKLLFRSSDADINTSRGWSVSSDGQRILGIRTVTPASDARRITVVENWHQEFEGR